MDPNEILALFAADDFDVTTLTAEELAEYATAFAEYRAGLVAGIADGSIAADSANQAAVRALLAAVGTIDTEIAERADRAATLLSELGVDADNSDAPTDVVDQDTEPEVETDPVDAPELVTAASTVRLPVVSIPTAPPTQPEPSTPTRVVPRAGLYASAATSDRGSDTPMSDSEVTERLRNAFAVSAGATVGYWRQDIPQAVKASDFRDPDAAKGILAAAHRKWRETLPERRAAVDETQLSPTQRLVASACIPPARPVLDLAGPCPVMTLTDALPTVETTERLAVYPRPMTDYSAMPAQGFFYVTSAQHQAGYVSNGGPTPDKTCAQPCPGDPIECDPVAIGWCVEADTFTRTFWPQAQAQVEETFANYARVAHDYRLLETLYDPTGSNPLIHKMAPVTDSPFGAAVDIPRWISELLALAKACTGCDADVAYLPEFLLARMVADHQARNGIRLGEARADVMAAMGAEDGMTILTYGHAPATWLGAGTPAVLGDGSPLAPTCVSDGSPLSNVMPKSAALILGRTDSLTVVRHADLTMRVDRPATNSSQMLAETISTACVTGDHYVVEVPVCVKGATGAMAVVDCPAP